MTIDRPARNQTSDALERFLLGETTEASFDDEMMGIESDDPVVDYVVDNVWFLYDDFAERKVSMSKPLWGFCNLLLLLLQSDCTMEDETIKHRHLSQIFAALLLVAYALCCLKVADFSTAVFIIAMPFGAISFLLSKWRQLLKTETVNASIEYEPFESWSQLLAVRRSVPDFKKIPQPESRTAEYVEANFSFLERFFNFLRNGVWAFAWYFLWATLAFIPLFFQMFPVKETKSRVVAP